jgi:signal transduction histidine kinase
LAPPAARTLLQVAGIAAIYFAAAKVALLLAIPPGYATPVWPSAGLALAALMRGGPQLWPAVFIGAAAVNFTINESLAAALAIGVGNTLEALLGALAARRVFGAGNDPFDRPVQIFQFVGIALGCALVAASVGTGALVALGQLGSGPPGSGPTAANWLTWWLGDAAGMLIIGPLMLAWTGGSRRAAAGRGGELIAFAVLLVAVCVLFYVNWAPGGRPLPLGFLILPLLAWAALRFGEREVATACAVTAGVTVFQASQGGGPFVAMDLTRALLLLQTFLATLAATSLALAVAMQALRRTALALHDAREEMEQFLDVAAHDMQEPLRNVLNFSDLLRLRHGAQLGRDGGEYLGYVISSAQRMERVIEDLLAVARAGRGSLRAAATDSGAALAAALANLRAASEEARAEVTHGTLPRVRADPQLLESVFQNLVGNAIKFRGAAVPRVHVSARHVGADWQFSVQDNGIGIDPAYFEVIFDMFERLDPREGEGSTGVGLAICRRIVERHGGRLWVESARGAGSTFHFTLPAYGDEDA